MEVITRLLGVPAGLRRRVRLHQDKTLERETRPPSDAAPQG
ncbi:hypothetical protein OEM_42480 [Mycobacterium intracellulare subsp. yongonense 05-1390]|nr:hypothetical protein OEM_42480 [Mycobacterium intracellulare subsp. yongonense 05-1390]